MRTRAKFELVGIAPGTVQETLIFMAVTQKPFDKDGVSEDNDFARWTPSGKLEMTVTNPTLIGKFTQGAKYYLDITETVD